MNRFFILIALISIHASLPGQQEKPVLIQDIHILQPGSEQEIGQADLLIESGKIAGIYEELREIPDGTEILSGTGKYLTVGFTDAHIHFFQNGGLYTRPDALDLRALRPYEEEIDRTWEAADRFMRQYLAAGVTMVCDVGGPMYNYEIRDESLENMISPEVRITGPLISTYVPPALVREDAPIVKINGPEEARALVRKQLPHDPDFIKIWFIVFPGQSPSASAEIVSSTIAESHAHGIPVAVHATQLETARLAVELGADILVHSVDDQKVDQEFVDLIMENEVSYIPTLIVSKNYEKAFTRTPNLAESDFFLSDPVFLGTLMDLKHIPDLYIPAYIRNMPIRDNSAQEAIMAYNLKTLFDAGANVVLGTDAGNLGTLHAGSFYQEWQAMMDAGLSVREVYQTATSNAGKMLNDKAYGTIEAGNRADLVIWSKHPFEEGFSPANILYTIKDGQVMSPVKELLAYSPEDLAQKQLNAYNARNLEAFLDCYSDSITIYNFPDGFLAKGKEAMRNMYGPMFESTPTLHCELVNRIVVGNRVIDEELVEGFGGTERFHAVAIYEIEDGLIQTVHFLQ